MSEPRVESRTEPYVELDAEGAPRATLARHPATVLVVDNTEGNRYTVARMLRGAGYEVPEAGTGMEALAQARAPQPPDLVVLDINLPDISGYEVVQRLKADPATAAIPVLHLSATYVESADQAYGLEVGADARVEEHGRTRPAAGGEDARV